MNRVDDVERVIAIPKKSYLKWSLLLFSIILVLFVVVLIGVIVAMATASNTAVLGFEAFVLVCIIVAFILLGLVTYATKFIYSAKYPNTYKPVTLSTTSSTTKYSVPTEESFKQL